MSTPWSWPSSAADRRAGSFTIATAGAHFAEIAHGEVTRYELPKIGALNFVLRDALGGGVTRSLALDAHGKGLSSAILDLEIPDEDQPV